MSELFALLSGDPPKRHHTALEARTLARMASPEVAAFARAGTETGVLHAIRLYRRQTGAGLAEALCVVKMLQATPPPGGSKSTPPSRPDTFS